MTRLQGQRTELLVLGTSHLSAKTPDTALESTLSRLKNWQPDAVCVEVLPGEVVDTFRREGISTQVLGVGGYPQALALEALARPLRPWNRAEAVRIARASGTVPVDRVLAWVLALEPLNACFHLQPDMDLPEEVQRGLENYFRSSEMRRLAVPLAQEMGHAELHHIDDHTGMEIYERHEAELTALWQRPEFKAQMQAHPIMRETPARMQAGGDHWEFLRWANAPSTVAASFDLESGLYLNTDWPGPAARARLAQWDTRNLFMAARVRRVTAHFVRGRVLVVVGSAHKGPLEAALSAQGADVRLVRLEELEQ